MTATPAVIGLSAGNRLLATSFGSTDLAPPDAHPSLQFAPAAPKLTVVAHRASSSSPAGHARAHAIRALRNHSAPVLAPPLPLPPPPADPAPELDTEFEFESSLEAIVLLQRSMLEKQWELPFEDEDEEDERLSKATVVVARSGVSARQRRMSGRRRGPGRKNVTISPERWGELGHPPSMPSGGVRRADGAPEEPVRRRIGGPPRGTGGCGGQHRDTEAAVQAVHAVHE